jgi:hypothetical protein
MWSSARFVLVVYKVRWRGEIATSWSCTVFLGNERDFCNTPPITRKQPHHCNLQEFCNPNCPPPPPKRPPFRLDGKRKQHIFCFHSHQWPFTVVPPQQDVERVSRQKEGVKLCGIGNIVFFLCILNFLGTFLGGSLHAAATGARSFRSTFLFSTSHFQVLITTAYNNSRGWLVYPCVSCPPVSDDALSRRFLNKMRFCASANLFDMIGHSTMSKYQLTRYLYSRYL